MSEETGVPGKNVQGRVWNQETTFMYIHELAASYIWERQVYCAHLTIDFNQNLLHFYLLF